jgi:GxxExxY protein
MLQKHLPEAQLTGSVIGAFYEVYNTLGFGFLEHIYKAALERELLARGHKVAREVAVVVLYKGHPLAVQRLDMIVDDKLVVESKSTAELHPSARRQLHNYLRATILEVGLLLHFGLQPKFYRVVELHTRRATPTKGGTDLTDATDSTDRSSAHETPCATSPDDDSLERPREASST